MALVLGTVTRNGLRAGLTIALALGVPQTGHALTGTSIQRDATQDQAGLICGTSQLGIRLNITGNTNDAGGQDFGAIALFDGSGPLLASSAGSVTVGTTITPSFGVPLAGITARPVIFRLVELTNDTPPTPPIVSAPVLTSLVIDPATVFAVCASLPLVSIPTMPTVGLVALGMGLAGLGFLALRRRRLAATPA